MHVKEWPAPEDFDRTFCRAVRRQWTIHPHRVTERAKLEPGLFANWERGKWRSEPLGFRMMVYAALRQIVAEEAMLTLQLLGDVEPFARRRVEYNALVRSIVGPRRRHPKDPRLAKPPAAATPRDLGWMPE
jgi:hypothetical protein